jgi:hypothetical protein
VIDELAPGIHEGGDTFRVRHVRIAGADHKIADGARIVAAERDGDAVGEMRFPDTSEFGAGSVEGGIGLIVLRAVEAAVFNFCRLRTRLARRIVMAMPAMRLMRPMRMAGKIAEVKIVAVVVVVSPSPLELAHSAAPLSCNCELFAINVTNERHLQ